MLPWYHTWNDCIPKKNKWSNPKEDYNDRQKIIKKIFYMLDDFFKAKNKEVSCDFLLKNAKFMELHLYGNAPTKRLYLQEETLNYRINIIKNKF